jgi:hypothetical protein
MSWETVSAAIKFWPDGDGWNTGGTNSGIPFTAAQQSQIAITPVYEVFYKYFPVENCNIEDVLGIARTSRFFVGSEETQRITTSDSTVQV